METLYELKLSIWLEASLQIKQAGGMQRGKTDKVDAQRIAQYAYRFRDQVRLWQPPREVMQKLAFLSATRQRLNQAYNLLAVPVAEQETFISKTLQKILKGNVKKSLAALKEEQKAVEAQIHDLIQADARLKDGATRAVVRSDGLCTRRWPGDRYRALVSYQGDAGHQ